MASHTLAVLEALESVMLVVLDVHFLVEEFRV
jgi:hypothetical protein